MTKFEFKEWLEYHQDTFPSVRKWWATEVKNVAETMRQWYRPLEHVDLQDAKQATDRLIDGREEWDRYRKLDDLPIVIREIAGRVRAGRVAPVKKNYDPGPVSFREVAEATSELVKRYEQGLQEGRGKREMLESLIPVDPAREARYRCLWCRDTGLAEVWTNRSIHECMHGQEVKKRSGVMRCTCDQGSKRPGEQLALFDPDLFALFEGGDLDQLADWCDAWKERKHRAHDFGDYAMPTIPIR